MIVVAVLVEVVVVVVGSVGVVRQVFTGLATGDPVGRRPLLLFTTPANYPPATTSAFIPPTQANLIFAHTY